jgi:RNA polymerase sigma-70 factor (ECF subfamily)
MDAPPHTVTVLLHEWRAGSKDALDRLIPLVYDQLHRIAKRSMHNQAGEYVLRPTAVIHEAYLKMLGANIDFRDRAHFFAVSAQMMRRILLDWAKANTSQKRGGPAAKISLDEASVVGVADPETLILLDLALQRLANFDQRKASLVEMIFFGGLTYDEAAEALQVSAVTVHRELKMAKAWLFNELRPGGQQ